MRNEFTAIVERDGPWHIVYCAEGPELRARGIAGRRLRSTLLQTESRTVAKPLRTNGTAVVYDRVFVPLFSPVNASLGHSLLFGLIMFAFAYFLYPKQWFLKL